MTVRVIREYGTIEDDGNGGSQWVSDDIEFEDTECGNVGLSLDSHIWAAIEAVRDSGCSQDNGDGTFYDPDGSRVVNYRTGYRVEVSAHLYGFTPEQIDRISEALAD